MLDNLPSRFGVHLVNEQIFNQELYVNYFPMMHFDFS